MKNLPPSWIGYGLVFLYTFLGAIWFLCFEYIFRKYPEVQGVEVNFWGIVFAVLVLTPFVWAHKKSRRNIIKTIKQDNGFMLGVSALTGIAGVMVSTAVEYSDAGITTLLNNSEIIFMVALGVLWLKEHFSWKHFLALGVACVGLFLVANLEGEVSILVLALVFGAQFLYALQNVVIKKYAHDVDPQSFAFVRMHVMGLAMLPIYFVLGGKMLPWDAFLIAGGVSVLCVYISRAALYQAFKYIPASSAGTWFFAETAMTVLGTILIFGAPASWQKILGAVLIFMGIYLFQRAGRGRM